MEKLQQTVQFIRQFDIVNTPLVSQTCKFVNSLILSPDPSFYTNRIVLKPHQVVVMGNRQVVNAIENEGVYVVDLTVDSRISLQIFPLYNA